MADEEGRAAAWRDAGDGADADRVCVLRQSPVPRSQGCSRPVRRENPLSWKAEQGKGDRAVPTEQSGKGAEVRAGKQPNLSFQCDIAAKGPHRSSGWMKGGAAD